MTPNKKREIIENYIRSHEPTMIILSKMYGISKDAIGNLLLETESPVSSEEDVELIISFSVATRSESFRLNKVRVMCIDASIRPSSIDIDTGFEIKEGEIYTVINIGLGRTKLNTIIPMYFLEEDHNKESLGYDMDRFIPLSN